MYFHNKSLDADETDDENMVQKEGNGDQLAGKCG